MVGVVGLVGGAFDVLGPAIDIFCCYGAGAQPGGDGGGFSSSVCELDADFLALGVRELGDGFEAELALEVVIAPDSAVFRCDAAFGDDGCGFDEGEAWAARDYTAKMGEVPAFEVAVLG